MKISRRNLTFGLASALVIGLGLAAREARKSWPRPAPEWAPLFEKHPHGNPLFSGELQWSGEWFATALTQICAERCYSYVCVFDAGQKKKHLIENDNKLFEDVAGVSVTSDGERVAFCLDSKGQSFIQRRQPFQKTPLQVSRFYRSVFSPDNRTLYTFGNSTLSHSDVRTGRLLKKWTLPPFSKSWRFNSRIATLISTGEAVRMGYLNDKHQELFIKRFNPKTERETQISLRVTPNLICELSPSTRWVGAKTVRSKSQICLFDGLSGKMVWSQFTPEQFKTFTDMKFSPDETVWAVLAGKRFYLYETRTGNLLQSLLVPGDQRNGAPIIIPNNWHFSPDSKQLLVDISRGNAKPQVLAYDLS